MSGFSWALQQAVFTALNTAPALAGGRIYDHADADVTFPFIEIGPGQAIPDDTSATAGSDSGISEFIDIHLRSRYRGAKEIKELADTIHTRLHGQSLTVTGRASALAWVRTVRTMTDADGLSQHGIVSVEVVHRS